LEDKNKNVCNYSEVGVRFNKKIAANPHEMGVYVYRVTVMCGRLMEGKSITRREVWDMYTSKAVFFMDRVK